MKHKSILTLGSGAAVLLLLIFLLIYWEPTPPQSATGSESTQSVVPVYLAGSALVSIDIDNTTSSYTILVADPGGEGEHPQYAIEGLGQDIPLSQNLLLAVGKNALSLDALEHLGQVADLSPFGFAAPGTVVLRFADGTSTTLQIGGSSPDGQGVYLTARGDNLAQEEGSLFVVPLSSVYNYLLGAVDYITPTVTGVTTKGVDFTTVRFGGWVRQEPIVIRREDATEAGSYGRYSLLLPVEREMSVADGLPVLQTLFGLTADNAVAVDPSEDTLRHFGLLDPYSTAEIIGADMGDFRLIASQPDGDDNVYLMREGVPVVYLLGAYSLPWLEMQFYDFFDPYVLAVSLDTVDTILVETPEEAYRFVVSGDGESMAVSMDGQEMALSRFTPYYQSLTSAVLEEFTDDVPREEDLLLRVAFTFQDGSTTTLRFYTGPARKCFVLLDGDAFHYYTASTYVDRLVQDAARLRSGEAVSTYR